MTVPTMNASLAEASKCLAPWWWEDKEYLHSDWLLLPLDHLLQVMLMMSL